MQAKPLDDDIARVRSAASALMPSVVDQLATLVRIRSIAGDDHSAELTASAETVADLVRATGLFHRVDVEHRAVLAVRAPRRGAPSIVLYAHHDVQPPGEAAWLSEPFEPAERDGRLYGRGTADDKAGVLVHLAALDILRSEVPDPDLGVVLIIDGEEEEGSPSFPRVLESLGAHVRADAVVIADSENSSSVEPALVSSMRGQINILLKVATLDHPLHAGSAGGAYPDAMIPMARLLASFHRPDGSVAIEGLDGGGTSDSQIGEELFRYENGVLADVRPLGSEGLATKLWRRPTVTVTGMDLPDPAVAPTVLVPSVTAKLSIRLAPTQDLDAAWEALRRHVAQHTEFGACVEIVDAGAARGVLTETDGAIAGAMIRALEDGWSHPVGVRGTGASASLVAQLGDRFPDAPLLLTGVVDPESRAHGTDESVSLDVLRKAITAEALFLLRLESDADA